MGYFTELRTQWRPLLAALIGLGSGFSLVMYTTSIMAPHFLKEFGWSKADFALVGSLTIFTFATIPFVGRLTDIIGVRRTALIGVVAIPLAYLSLSQINADIRIYIALFIAQAIVCITTTSTVYSRVVVQYVKQSRGLALAIVASGPAITGAIGGPLLNNFVEAHGWRAGYVALAIFSAVAGGFALLIMPSERRPIDAIATPKTERTKKDYAAIFKNRAFPIMLGAMLLCNLPQSIATSQLNLVLLEKGATAAEISILISVFAIGTLSGRFISGLALDRYPAHIVSALSMGLPSLGLFLLASGFGEPSVLLLAVFLIGFSFGAEGDLVGYLVVRKFGVNIYSSVLGLMTCAMAISSSIGAIMLSVTLKQTGSYSAFLLMSGIAVALGSALFLLLASAPEEARELKTA